MTKPKPPSKAVTITFSVTETPEGKLHVGFIIPDHAAGTVALVVANAAIEVMKGMLKDAGVKKEAEHHGSRH